MSLNQQFFMMYLGFTGGSSDNSKNPPAVRVDMNGWSLDQEDSLEATLSCILACGNSMDRGTDIQSVTGSHRVRHD